MDKISAAKLDEIKCPKCGALIPVSETLRHQIVEQVERESNERIGAKEEEFRSREEMMKKQEEALAQNRKDIDQRIEEGVRAEKKKLEKEMLEKAKKDASLEVEDMKNQLAEKDEKLKEAEKTELALRKRERTLEDREKNIELEAERRLSAERQKIEEDVSKRMSEQHRMKEAEKEKTINDLKPRLEEAQRRAEQGSQQLQGEVKELDLEKILKEVFSFDEMMPVAKGVRGADILQQVKTKAGVLCGTILWEIKRTKSWSDGWVGKLKDDQREAKADVAVIVTDVTPKEISNFGQRGDIWITKNEFLIGLAVLLRDALIAVATTKLMSESKDEKVEILFRYLTGPEFKQKIEGVVDAFVSMKDDLEKEKRIAMARWAKQDKYLQKALGSVAGMHGDLRGLIGNSMQTIPLLESGEEDSTDEASSRKSKKKKSSRSHNQLIKRKSPWGRFSCSVKVAPEPRLTRLVR
jgi:hypothetical protein